MKTWKIIFWVIIAVIIALTALLAFFSPKTKADLNTNINPDTLQHFSWNNLIGWFNFYDTNTVNVTNTELTGYASSSVGDVSLDCATTRDGNVCGASAYGVKNDGNGLLYGYGWNKNVGWISFNCNQPDYGINICVNSDYLVRINIATGNFNGFGWNPIVGWVSFNCANPGTNGCDPGNGGSNYKVNTNWRAQAAAGSLESSIFDTQIQPGAILNSIIWQGDQPSGTQVKFQIATSNCSNGASDPPTCSTGTWNYYGQNQNPNDYFEGSGQNQSILISGNDRAWVNNKRYLRYKVFLESNTDHTASPVIRDIILNWSK